MEGIALELWGWTRGSTGAAGRGWGLQGHQGSALPSLPEQTYPADPSQASWARLGMVTRVGHSLAIPRHRGAQPGRHPLGRDGDGVRAVPGLAGPRARQGQGCSIRSAY